MQLLKVYQIHYDKAHLLNLEREYTPYYNSDCTVFFENTVIAKLINEGEHKDSEYFAVISHKLREKIGTVMKEAWASLPNIANHSIKEFTPQLFENELQKQKPDVMSFQRHIPHDPVSFANKFHPGFSNHFKEIMLAIGYDWQPTHIKNVFYCNFFAAKSEVYERYVNEMLIPAMKVMLTMPQLYDNSRYPRPLPHHLQEKFGIKHFPYHPFLCERMFSYFAHIHNLNCLHY